MDNLARDSTRAIEAGMSYGMWKALHPHTKHETEQLDEGKRPCRWCGNPIPSHFHPNVKYCCDKCKAASDREKVLERYHKNKKLLGDENRCKKLTAQQVMEARNERAKGATFPEIAKQFGVATSTIRRAVIGEAWKNVPMGEG